MYSCANHDTITRRRQMINHMQQGPENPTYNSNYGRPLALGERIQNLGSKQRNINHSEVNQRNDTPNSVVINLDNINEPSTSYPLDSCTLFPNRLFPKQCQLNMPEVESTGKSNEQNLSNESGERNSSVELPESRYFNNNNNNNEDNNNSNNSTSSVREHNQVAGMPAENPNPRTNSENQSFDEDVLNKYMPFLTFVSFMTIYDHREGILIFIGLFVTFIHANYVIKREVAKQNRRSLTSLGIIFVNLLVSICLIYFVFQDQQLYKNLIFIPPYSQPLTIWDVLWVVGITDFVLKFITIQLKVGMVCFPGKLLAFSARGKWYHVLERASQLYRGLAPIQPWLYYLMEVYQGPENTVGMFFSVAYAISKGSDITCKAKLFVKAIWKLLHNSSLGTHPSKEQLVTAGSQCPICHDEYNAPIVLQCQHIFCESCVTVWFDREQTCPLCRAKIADDPSWRDGATSFFTQLF